MMQMYCPACENVVRIECGEPDEVSPCPACNEPIHWLGRRKARPLHEGGPGSIVAVPDRITRPAESPPPAQPAPLMTEWTGDDLDVPCPDRPASRFVALPYRAEGGVRVSRLPIFVVGMLLTAVVLGALASAIGQACYLILISPLLLGLGLAGLSMLEGQLCQVRAPWFAALTALVAGFTAVGTMHLLDHRRTMHLVETSPMRLSEDLVLRLRESPRFVDYFDAVAAEGLSISGRGNNGLNLGARGTYAYWGIEVFLVAVIAALGGATGAREPYCTSCRRWKEDRFLGTIQDGGAHLERRLRQGRLDELTCHAPSERSGELVLTASVCACCGSRSPIDLRIERNPRSPREPHSTRLPMQLSYPGEALPVLEKLFAPRIVERKDMAESVPA